MSDVHSLSSMPGRQPSGVRLLASAFWLLPLAWLWFVLIHDLCVEWTVNPQYAYGWAVPFLCLFLLWQRTTDCGPRTTDHALRMSVFQFPPSILIGLVALCALFYAPTRLVEEANPGWRLVSWALALETVGLTLCILHLMTNGGSRTAESGSPSSVLRPPFCAFVFPICYFLVAVPWPSAVEGYLIQGLTRLDTGITTELLGWFGIPAIPHGNVIEVATGMVGIDEACSGIRSFQATLMISLFLGEFYRLSVFRRAVLCLSGFALSALFNLARMALLVWVAAHNGIGAIASWHDPAGVTILVACFFSLWGMGVALKGGKRKAEDRPQVADDRRRKSDEKLLASDHRPPSSAFRRLGIALGAWILVTEISIEGWYLWHEARVPQAAQWTVAWPTNNETFREAPLAARTRQILRYDEGRSAGWTDGGIQWQAVFLRWKPGRTAIHLAENHTPNICMTGAGYQLDSIAPEEWFEAGELRMPFSVNEVTNTPQPFFVFYCLWDDRASVQGFQTADLTYGNRLAPVLAGLRNPGQRSLEIAVAGPDNPEQAEAALRAELAKLVSVSHQ